MIVDFILITHHLALDEREAGALVEFEACLHVEAAEPRPCRSLMVGIVALCLRANVHGVVATALRRERAKSLRGEQLARTYIYYALHLLLRQRRVVESHGEDHVRANAPVHHIAIHVVEQIAVLVDEGVDKRLLGLGSQGLEVFLSGGVAVVLSQRRAELQGVVPQGVELHDVARAGHHGTSVGRGVHPRHGTVATVGVEQAIVVETQVGMATLLNIFHDVGHQLLVALVTVVATGILGILLHGPYGPERHVGLLHLVDLYRERLALHELAQSSLGGLHHQLEVVLLVDGQRQARQGDERVAGTALVPGIACEQVAVVVGFAVVELMGGCNQAMIEIVARSAQRDLLVEERLQRARLDGRGRSGEDDALALLDRHLEVAGHVEVLVGEVATLLLLGILHAAIPVGLEHELVLLGELHVQIGIPGIHTGLDTIIYFVILAAGHRVFVGQRLDRAECQERTEAQRSGRVGIVQSVANEDAILIGLEDGLFPQHHAAHAIRCRRHEAAIKLTDVLVSLRTEVVALILVETQVEFGSVLDDRAVER